MSGRYENWERPCSQFHVNSLCARIVLTVGFPEASVLQEQQGRPEAQELRGRQVRQVLRGLPERQGQPCPALRHPGEAQLRISYMWSLPDRS